TGRVRATAATAGTGVERPRHGSRRSAGPGCGLRPVPCEAGGTEPPRIDRRGVGGQAGTESGDQPYRSEIQSGVSLSFSPIDGSGRDSSRPMIRVLVVDDHAIM